MKLGTILFAFLFTLALTAAYAQTSEPETAPDAKAYQDASRITDPLDKIAALEKFKKDFPDSSSVTSADMSILSTLASKMPDQTARIQQIAKTIFNGAKDKKEKGS